MKTRNTAKLQTTGKSFFLMAFLFFLMNSLIADQIDLGIFESASPGEIEIRMRPDFTITAGTFILEIRYTVRWQDPTITITGVTNIPPYNLPLYFPEAPGITEPILSNGYYYQSFQNFVNLAFPANINNGEEVVISRFNYTGGGGSTMELSNENYTAFPVTYFYELGPGDRTGIFYQDSVVLSQPLAVPLSYLSVILFIALISVFFIFKILR